jgi:FkbM family methyltransferase
VPRVVRLSILTSTLSFVRGLIPRLSRRENVAVRPTSPYSPQTLVDSSERDFYSEYLRHGMMVFDVGANEGELTILFAKAIGSGEVHAFEPCRATYDALETHCMAVGLDNVRLHRLALSNKEGTADLHLYDAEFSGMNTFAERPLAKYGSTLKTKGSEVVQTSTVDEQSRLANVDFIDLLKVDVEGAEYQVLLGARKMLEQKRIGCCTLEFGQTTFDMGNDPGEIEMFLSEMGYEIHNVVSGDPVFPGRESVMSAQFSMHVISPIGEWSRR